MKPWVLVLAAVLAIGSLYGCAKKNPQPEFRPLQLQWAVLPGQDEGSMENRDGCMVRLTGVLMGEPAVQASRVDELEYLVQYGKSLENASVLEFSGRCGDGSLMGLPECRWSATCDAGLNIVVKFHNGD